LEEYSWLDSLLLVLIDLNFLHSRYNPLPTDKGRVNRDQILSKAECVRLRQVEHVNSEREILASVHHPFIVDMFLTFQTPSNLFMCLEYMVGGELFSHLRKEGRFVPDVAKFYAASIVLALEYLHENDIIYRDLKPEVPSLTYLD
jgi:serine/threonine protein kinase